LLSSRSPAHLYLLNNARPVRGTLSYESEWDRGCFASRQPKTSEEDRRCAEKCVTQEYCSMFSHPVARRLMAKRQLIYCGLQIPNNIALTSECRQTDWLNY
jgi:hypothetical protein